MFKIVTPNDIYDASSSNVNQFIILLLEEQELSGYVANTDCIAVE